MKAAIFFQEQVLKTALECEARPGWHLKFDVIDMKKQVLLSVVVVFGTWMGEELGGWVEVKGKNCSLDIRMFFFVFWYLFFWGSTLWRKKNIIGKGWKKG